MIALLKQLKWELILLQKNNIITISIAITIFYGLVLFLLKNLENMEVVLTVVVLNDPATIGYFFVGLAISLEKKSEVLAALFITPLNHHVYLLARVLAISVVGLICALLLAVLVTGLAFNVLLFSCATFGIAVMSALLGIIVVSYQLEFLKFALYSVPVFLLFVILPMLDYLGVFNLGVLIYLLPLHGSLQLLVHSYGATATGLDYIIWTALMLVWIIIMYAAAFKVFHRKVINA